MHRPHSIQTFVHRTLVFRLLAAGLVLSLLLGLTVLFIERDRVSLEIIDLAVEKLAEFSDRYDHLLSATGNMEPEKIRQAIIEFRAGNNLQKLGSFVFVGIYDPDGKTVAEIFNQQHPLFGEMKKKQLGKAFKLPDISNDQYQIIKVAGLPCLKISLPLIIRGKDTAGFVNGIFAFSAETISAFRWRGVRAMTGSILIVLLTTAILYPVILKLTRRISRFSEQLLDANLGTLETLGSAIAQRDSDTNAHNYRVTIYVVRIGEELGLPHQTMRTLIKGSFLHDVGKIGIADEILLKPGKLSDDEFAIMKTHVEQGRAIIQRSKWLHDALEVVLSHHEKVEGKGYPLGLAGEAIPITARIFAIADVFDALTSKRPYKEPWPFQAAIEILEEGRGTHFDPLLLDAFLPIAQSLYDKFGGKEEIFREELAEIIQKYFYQGMDSLEY